MKTIEGIITLTSPLHCADPISEWRLDMDKNRPIISKSENTLPLKRTVRQSLILTGRTSDIINDEKGGLTDVGTETGFQPTRVEFPYFPANDLRGRLRRQAAKVIFDQLYADGETINIDTYSGMTSGNFSGQPDSMGTSLNEINAAREHIFMGVFGGGPRTLSSQLVTHDVLPVIEPLLIASMIPSRYDDDICLAKPFQLFNYLACVKRDDILEFLDLSAKNYVTDYFDVVNQRQDEAQQNKTARQNQKNLKAYADDKVKKSTIRNMVSFEVIQPGTKLYLKIGLSDYLNDAQIGLVLEALCRLVNQQNLGGLVRWGFGQYKFNASMFENGRRVMNTAIGFDETSHTHKLHDDCNLYIEAMTEILEIMTAEDLERFFKNGSLAA